MATDRPLKPEEFEDILADVRTHGLVRRALRERNIEVKSFYRYVNRDDETRAELNKARVDGLDAMADECNDIADTPRIGRIVKRGKDKDGNKLITIEVRDNIERTRLQIDTRKWLLAHLHPQKYGEHISIDQTVRQAEAKQIEERLNDGIKRLSLVR